MRNSIKYRILNFTLLNLKLKIHTKVPISNINIPKIKHYLSLVFARKRIIDFRGSGYLTF